MMFIKSSKDNVKNTNIKKENTEINATEKELTEDELSLASGGGFANITNRPGKK